MKSDFIIALTQLAAERNLPRGIVLSAIEAALASAYRKDSIATGQDISVKLDPASGEVSVYAVKTVVEEVSDPQQEISLEDAKKIKPDAEMGAIVPTESLPQSAGRIAAQTAKQVVIQRLREAERDLIYQEFADKEGEVFTVTVQRLEPRQIIVELGRAEAILPASEQAVYERPRIGQKMRVLLQSVRQSNRGPEIIVSRADKLLLKRLFEMEVPEIYNGSVEIVEIAREAGSRSKVAVWSKQDGVDAVGSCVGLRGIRIQNIVNELYGEKIDVVQWNRDPAAFIASALSPSLVMRVEIDQETGTAMAVVPERQISLAIGKEGQNARLAARLTGWKVDIKSDVEAEALAKPKPEPVVEEEAAVASTGVVPAADSVIEKAEAIVEQVSEPALEDAGAKEIAAEVVAAEPAAEIVEEPAAEVEPEVQKEAVPVAEQGDQPEPVLVEATPAELFIPEEEEPVEVGVGAAERSTSIQDLPDEIWSVRSGSSTETGVLRFAEDIVELGRGEGSRRGRRSGGSRRGGGRGRRSGTGRRR